MKASEACACSASALTTIFLKKKSRRHLWVGARCCGVRLYVGHKVPGGRPCCWCTPADSLLLPPTRHTHRLRAGAGPDPRDHNASQGWAAFRGVICGSELGAAESACRPQSPRQQAMLLGHPASAPCFGASGCPHRADARTERMPTPSG